MAEPKALHARVVPAAQQMTRRMDAARPGAATLPRGLGAAPAPGRRAAAPGLPSHRPNLWDGRRRNGSPGTTPVSLGERRVAGVLGAASPSLWRGDRGWRLVTSAGFAA